MKIEEFIIEIKALGIILNQEQFKQLEEFYKILVEENRNINLTRIIEQEDVYLKHFYDSLTLAKAIDLTKNLTLCDVGTGAGFPGIVLKIVFPNLKITLIDALQKRVNYLKRVIERLNLTDIEAIHMRSEEYARKNRETYDIVTARAVANLKTLSEICLPLVKVDGYFLPMKAKVETELEESQAMIGTLGGKIEKIYEFTLPIENSERTILKIKKVRKTNQQYPRHKIK